MKRILLDQGLPLGTTLLLNAAGWDVIHASEVGLASADDGAILEYAAKDGRVAVTLDRDFPQILALTASERPSVVLIRQQRLRAVEVAELLKSVWRDHEPALDGGCVARVSQRGIRLRRLPLK